MEEMDEELQEGETSGSADPDEAGVVDVVAGYADVVDEGCCVGDETSAAVDAVAGELDYGDVVGYAEDCGGYDVVAAGGAPGACLVASVYKR